MRRHVKRAKAARGAVICHERSEDGWCTIHVSIEKRGWIRSQDLEKVIAN
jgi:hypothetical protein